MIFFISSILFCWIEVYIPKAKSVYISAVTEQTNN